MVVTGLGRVSLSRRPGLGDDAVEDEPRIARIRHLGPEYRGLLAAVEDGLTVVTACVTAAPATANVRRAAKLPPVNEASPNTPVAQTGASRHTQATTVVSLQTRAKSVSHDQSRPGPTAPGPKVPNRTGFKVPNRTANYVRPKSPAEPEKVGSPRSSGSALDGVVQVEHAVAPDYLIGIVEENGVGMAAEEPHTCT